LTPEKRTNVSENGLEVSGIHVSCVLSCFWPVIRATWASFYRKMDAKHDGPARLLSTEVVAVAADFPQIKVKQMKVEYFSRQPRE
jgi:hypothetical protein